MNLLLLFTTIGIQMNELPATDTLPRTQLDSVMVQGFVQRSPLASVPAAISIAGSTEWNRYSPGSSIAAMNALPGVRMEERSPGSYRMAIRGSSLRSPFGVRNVRFYYEQFPITDPGGNTYLNLFAPAAFEQMEVLRGPAASVYGAGSGGALLATGSSKVIGTIPFRVTVLGGSNGLFQADAQVLTGTTDKYNRIQLHHQQASGYREHSSMRRNFISWQNKQAITENYKISTLVLYSDLEYQTPGGLTLAQYQADPKQARPAGGPFPSAQDAKATIYQQSFYGGVQQVYTPFTRLRLEATLYGMYNRITNPTIRNFERRTEPSFGTRALIGYTVPLSSGSLDFSAGAEWQKGYYQVNVFGNRGGEQDTLQSSDALTPVNALVFGQAQWKPDSNWEISAGISFNNNTIRIIRESVVPNYAFTSSGQAEWAPRISIARKLNTFTVYALAAKGFSPPTSSELLPSTSVINTNLQAEYGWNYELGFRGRVAKQRIWLDANIFYFQLKDAIVQRRDASGADFFTNAGSTRQWGIELASRYSPLKQHPNFSWQPWFSYTYHPFQYRDFTQIEADYSGNRIPGIARQTVAAGLDLQVFQKADIHLTYQYVDPIFLNDANSAKAKAYQLVGAKLGAVLYKMTSKKGNTGAISWFAGADNLLNQNYSLGNDINAVGGRYYNAAARRNYFTGIRVQ
ncbi:TonB-dependent receptor [Flavihumibacter sp. UBA7668]|uniref:TonB-dependent receptor n=1 Tax=Flavihumibacter sp. UBA7668 TaxID=1946542 RepID=UPI0025B8CC50|nr:TonB-dependent receptor [Flavihumibacter sp. UBA7668]